MQRMRIATMGLATLALMAWAATPAFAGQIVYANGRTITHKGSQQAGTPAPIDVAVTPLLGRPVPVPAPLPSIGNQERATSKVKLAGKTAPEVKETTFSTSQGDEPGVQKGVITSKNKQKTEFLLYSFDVKVEGKGVARMGDPLFHNPKSSD